MRYIRSFFLCAFLVLGFAACQSSDTSEAAQESVEITPMKVEAVSEKGEQEAVEELKVLETAIGQIPIYKTFDEVEYVFEQKNDTTYVVNFWATWCKPCVEELPYFEQIQEQYKDEKVQVVLVSLDFKKQLERKLKPFLEERKLQSRVVVLTDGKYNNWIDRVDEEWSGAIPVTVVYNANTREFIGDQFADFEELEELVKRISAS